tara:strand:- start:1165 stop:2313 length:1149 start_codon:yes stop_codon:yes gene_type:complete
MTSKINALTGSGGVAIEGDSSGILEFQSNGTTVMTVTSASQTALNKIINGDMRVDQRDGTATINATSVTYNVDRWLGRGVASAGVFTLAQDTTSPANFTNSLKATVTTADSSIASGSSYRVQQMIEGNNIADLNWGTSDAQSVTLSFWVRSSVTGTFGGSVANGDYDRFNVFSYTISVADTWEYKTVTITGDTSGTWYTNTSIGIRLNFSLGAGSTLLASAGSWGSSAKEGVTGQTNVIATNSATFYVTGVQLQTGSGASNFEYLQFGQQMLLCQRYFYSLGGTAAYEFIAHGMFTGTTTPLLRAELPVKMRSAPTLSTSGTFLTKAGSSNLATASFSVDQSATQTYSFSATVSGGSSTIGYAALMFVNNSTAARFNFSAEM